jgi:signal peptidase I
MSGAGRGVTPGTEPEAGSDQDTARGAQDTVQAGEGPATVQAGDGRAGQAKTDGAPDAAKASSDSDAESSTAPSGTAASGTAESSTAESSTAESSTAASGTADSGTADSGTGGSGPGQRKGKGKGKARGNRGARFLRELVILIVVALVIAVAVKTYAIQAFFIPSGSMQNTLEINDRVLVNKLVYDVRGIHRGDIVVFNGDGSWDPGQVPGSSNFAAKFVSGFASMFGFGNPGDILIKRVIGLPGDHVACCNTQGQVTVNGVALSEGSYLYPGDVPSEFSFNIIVPPGRLWVMGDHRSISDDSRDHMGDPGGGTIPESAVIGRAFVIIWPVTRWRILPIPSTFQQPKLNATASAASASAASAAGAGAADANTVIPAAVTAANDSAATASLLSARLEPTGPALPLSVGFAAAIPITWLRRRVARRRASHRTASAGRKRSRTSRGRSGE